MRSYEYGNFYRELVCLKLIIKNGMIGFTTNKNNYLQQLYNMFLQKLLRQYDLRRFGTALYQATLVGINFIFVDV